MKEQKFTIEVLSQGQWITVPATQGYNEFDSYIEAQELIPQLASDMDRETKDFRVVEL